MTLGIGIGLSHVFGPSKTELYLLRDLFSDTRAAGSVDGTAATPGPGTRVVVDTNSVISVGSGVVTVNGTPAANDHLTYALVERLAGRLGLIRFIDRSSWAAGASRFGFDAALGGSLDIGADAGTPTVFRIKDGVSVIDTVNISASPNPCDFAFVMRATGGFLFYNDDGDGWILAWIYDAENADQYFKVAHQATAVNYTFDNMRIPLALWLPTPIVSDGFADINGASLDDHSSDGLGHAEGVAGGLGSGGDGFDWTERNGTWDIQSNAANAAVPNPGAPGAIATVSASISDVIIDCTVTIGAGGNFASILLRYSDNDNLWWISANDADNEIQIYERNAGSDTKRASTAVTVPTGSPVTLRVIADAQNIDGYLDGGNLVSYGSAALNETAQIHGIQTKNAAGTYTFDNFVIYPRGTDEEYSALNAF